MLQIILFILLASFSNLNAKDCAIKSYSSILIFNVSDATNSHFIKKSTCSKKVSMAFQEILSNATGVIRETYLRSIFPQDNIKLIPNQIKIINLKHILPQKEDEVWSEIRPLLKQKIITYDEKIKYKIECQNCQSLGHKNIKISLLSQQDKFLESFWVNAVKYKQVNAFTLKTSKHHQGTILSKKNLKQKIIKTLYPERIFQDSNNIHFYKLTNLLKSETPLMKNHFIQRNIIKFGQAVKVTFKSNGVTLSGMATALSNGKINDLIKLKNMKNNKILFGKIIDFNKVSVQL